jgi:hypothetical protein
VNLNRLVVEFDKENEMEVAWSKVLEGDLGVNG